jgi:hypothetical protein
MVLHRKIICFHLINNFCGKPNKDFELNLGIYSLGLKTKRTSKKNQESKIIEHVNVKNVNHDAKRELEQ